MKRPASRHAVGAGTVSRKPATSSKLPRSKPASTTAAASQEKINSSLPAAVVVNLDRRQDRWKEVQQRLKSLQGLSFQRLKAVDGDSEAIEQAEVLTTWSTAGNWQYVTKVFEGGEHCGYHAKELQLTPGERGCAASHILAWRRVAAEEGALMILEDDATPTPQFRPLVAQALLDLRDERPDILYMGYTQAAPWRRKVGKAVREAEYLWTTVGYILWPSGARKLLAALPVDQPVDNFMSRLMASRELRGFAVKPSVLKQAKPWNVDNDVRHSDDAAWEQNA